MIRLTLSKAVFAGAVLCSMMVPQFTTIADSGGGGSSVPLCTKLLIPGSDASYIPLVPPCGVTGTCSGIWGTEPTSDQCPTVHYQTDVRRCDAVSYQGTVYLYSGGTCVSGVCTTNASTVLVDSYPQYVTRYTTTRCSQP